MLGKIMLGNDQHTVALPLAMDVSAGQQVGLLKDIIQDLLDL